MRTVTTGLESTGVLWLVQKVMKIYGNRVMEGKLLLMETEAIAKATPLAILL